MCRSTALRTLRLISGPEGSRLLRLFEVKALLQSAETRVSDPTPPAGYFDRHAAIRGAIDSICSMTSLIAPGCLSGG